MKPSDTASSNSWREAKLKMSVQINVQGAVYTIEPGAYIRKFALAAALALGGMLLAGYVVVQTKSTIGLILLVAPVIVAFYLYLSANNMRYRKVSVDAEKRELTISDPDTEPQVISLKPLRAVTLGKRFRRLSRSETLVLSMDGGKTYKWTGIEDAACLRDELLKVREDVFRSGNLYAQKQKKK